MYSIYKITNSINGKAYIGWTTRDPEIRFKEHRGESKKQRSNMPIHQAILKYGADNFSYDIIYQSDDYDHSRIMEGQLIIEHGTLVDDHGYNVELGGTGHHRSQSTIEKHRAKIKGRKQTDEHIEKRISKIRGEGNGMFGVTGELHPNYGKVLDDDVCANMSRGRREGIAKRKADGTYVKPNSASPESAIKIAETKHQQILDGLTQKYDNVVIEDPNGIKHELGYMYVNFLIDHKLNNFMSKSIASPGIYIKGHTLISYTMNERKIVHKIGYEI